MLGGNMETPMIHRESALLSLADIARHFSLPESTARYYCKRFAAFMPIHGEGRRRRYGQDTLRVVAMVLEHMRAGKNANAIESILSQYFARATETVVMDVESTANAQVTDIVSQTVPNAVDMRQSQDVPEFASFAMHLLEQQNAAMQSIAQSLAVLAAQQEDMHNLREAANMATEENIQLRKEVGTLKTLLHNTEEVHHDDLVQIRTWMSRLTRSYNNKVAMNTEEIE